MAERPYTLLSCSMSIDGYIDGASESRLLLSNERDFDRVDRVRAGVDAILVGATTVRNDNPRLLVRNPERRRRRLDQGRPEHPTKVTVTERGRLDPSFRFFADDGTDKLVYGSSAVVETLQHRLGHLTKVVDAGEPVRMRDLSEDLHARGVRRLMVEGGGAVHTQFLADDLVDELQLVVAPFFVGEPSARRFVGEARFPWHPGHRARLAATEQIGDVVLLRYALSERYEADELAAD
jgi:5-amino-6-(5-phosphoribosylamino)uracil reductase